MKPCHLYIIMCLFCLTAVSSCREEAVLPEPESHVPGKTLLTLNFTIDGQDAASRAGTDTYPNDDNPEYPSQDWEDKITSLQVFIQYEDGTWEEPIYIWEPTFNENKYTVELDKTINLSGATVYLGANLKLSQSLAFRNNTVYSLPINDFNVVTDFAPYSTKESDRINRPHIAMFCTEGKNPEKEETTTENGDIITNYSIESFSLKRLVAKVLVTCTEEKEVEGGEKNIVYVPVKQTQSEDFQGWIRQDEVKYLVNGLNRKAFIMQRIDEKAEAAYANVVDPNNELKDSPDNNDFFYQEIESNYSSYENTYFRTTSLFDAERLPETSDMDYEGEKPYTEGIYCPENTFVKGTISLSPEQAREQITHVCVTARFTPKKLYVEYALFDYIDNQSDIDETLKEEIKKLKPESSSGVVEVECPNEAIARQLLNSSIEMGKCGFPECSYFYHNINHTFYTYGAMGINVSFDDIEQDVSKLGNYVPYIGGWGYYYTYVNNNNNKESYGKPTGTSDYQYGQVERNRYYILNINSFSSPGSSFTNPDYIDVHTVSKDWIYGGEGEVILK